MNYDRIDTCCVHIHIYVIYYLYLNASTNTHTQTHIILRKVTNHSTFQKLDKSTEDYDFLILTLSTRRCNFLPVRLPINLISQRSVCLTVRRAQSLSVSFSFPIIIIFHFFKFNAFNLNPSICYSSERVLRVGESHTSHTPRCLHIHIQFNLRPRKCWLA